MDWVERVVQDFGQQIGLPELKLNHDRRLRLDADDGHSLGLVDAADLPIPELLVFISRPATYLGHVQLENAIRSANAATPWPVQVACSSKELLFVARLRHRSLSLSTLNEVIRHLKQIHADT